MPTVLRASRWCVSTIVIVVIAVVAAAVAVVLRTAAASPAAAAAFFFAPLRGGFEELVGVSSCRRVVAGRKTDLFGGVGSFPGEGVVYTALQFLLEQELEVFFSFSFGLVLLGGDPEVELLCIPVQRSQRLVGCCWVPFGGRLSEIGSMEEAEREEEEEGEEEEEESPKELEP